jgi:hypothetical protein
MQLSPEEAAQALAAIRASRESMRSAVRAHRGHYHLWLWGAIWIAMALLAEFRGQGGVHLFPWICAAGFGGSLVLGCIQGRQIRGPVDKRFLGVLIAVILFAVLGPFVLRAQVNNQIVFAYAGLVAMLCYVIAGIWFDTYLLWLGLAITALILVGLFCFAAFFWWWIAIFGGGTLIITGFYIRYFWR